MTFCCVVLCRYAFGTHRLVSMAHSTSIKGRSPGVKMLVSHSPKETKSLLSVAQYFLLEAYEL